RHDVAQRGAREDLSLRAEVAQRLIAAACGLAFAPPAGAARTLSRKRPGRESSMVILLLLFGAPPAVPAADPEAVVKRAIPAHGAGDRLARLRQMREQTRGTLLVLGTKIPFTSDTLMRLPGQFRSEIVTEVRGRKLRVIQVLDGPRGWL